MAENSHYGASNGRIYQASVQLISLTAEGIIPTRFLILLTITWLPFHLHAQESTDQHQHLAPANSTLIGNWIRMGHTGSIGLEFKSDGTVTIDFDNDQNIDVIANYELSSDTVFFTDVEGQMCQRDGRYLIDQTEYYLAFDLIADDCGGRIKTTLGFWTSPDFERLLSSLEKEISESSSSIAYLDRARIYLALGRSSEAKADLDQYLSTDKSNARAFINRAATRFPDEMAGAITDCNHALALDPQNKYGYFLRGSAKYALGEEEQACSDFLKAIELGFAILKTAEQEKCGAFWKE